MGLEPNKSSGRTAAMGVVEWQPCVAFDLVVPLGMQTPSDVQAGVVYDSSRPEAMAAEARAKVPCRAK